MKPTNVIAALCLLFASTAHGQGSDTPDSRVEFRLGGQTFTQFTTRLRIDSETLDRGTELVLEEDLAVDDKTSVGRLDGVLRFGGRHGFAMSYYDISREGTRVIAKEIHYGDTVFPVNSSVTTEFSQEIIKGVYRFKFLDKERGDLSASAGLHVMRFATTLQTVNATLLKESQTNAPLPVIGLQGAYKLGGKWSLNGSAELFDVTDGNLQGTFSDVIVAFEHQTFERFGFGFGFDRLGLKFEAGDDDLKGRLDIRFDAAMIYFNGRFGGVGR